MIKVGAPQAERTAFPQAQRIRAHELSTALVTHRVDASGRCFK